MNENRTSHLVEIPIGGKGGFIWNRLHGEREDICEALLTPSETTSQTHQRQDLLQARLWRIDDALDRLMSGSYGICSNCGRSIEDATLEVDAAWALCLDCWGNESRTGRVNKNENKTATDESNSEIILERLNSFDTLLLHTYNSDYRILLLDPRTGRALVEGGSYLPEPSEGLVKGSALPGSAFNEGAICVGGRLEMWVNERVFLTSPIKTVEVKHNAAAESLESISAALH
jgi:RNA polymerase-binding transcription factor DksA